MSVSLMKNERWCAQLMVVCRRGVRGAKWWGKRWYLELESGESWYAEPIPSEKS